MRVDVLSLSQSWKEMELVTSPCLRHLLPGGALVPGEWRICKGTTAGPSCSEKAERTLVPENILALMQKYGNLETSEQVE